jgi:hypothetical protein
MAPPNRTETEKRLAQLEADHQLFAKLLLGTHGATPALCEILSRHEVTGRENRPLAPLPESRAKVVA